MLLVHSISACGVKTKVELNHLLCPLDSGSQKYPDVTHSPEGLTQILLRPPDLVARARGTFLLWADVETELLPSLWWGKSWAGTSLMGSASQVSAALSLLEENHVKEAILGSLFCLVPVLCLANRNLEKLPSIFVFCLIINCWAPKQNWSSTRTVTVCATLQKTWPQPVGIPSNSCEQCSHCQFVPGSGSLHHFFPGNNPAVPPEPLFPLSLLISQHRFPHSSFSGCRTHPFMDRQSCPSSPLPTSPLEIHLSCLLNDPQFQTWWDFEHGNGFDCKQKGSWLHCMKKKCKRLEKR